MPDGGLRTPEQRSDEDAGHERVNRANRAEPDRAGAAYLSTRESEGAPHHAEAEQEQAQLKGAPADREPVPKDVVFERGLKPRRAGVHEHE